MRKIRAYADKDWPTVLEICLLAFGPIHESFERLLGAELFKLVYPDWCASNEKYLRSLTESAEKERWFMRAQGLKYTKVGTGGDESHVPARSAYEKFAFVPIPVVHYYKKL